MSRCQTDCIKHFDFIIMGDSCPSGSDDTQIISPGTEYGRASRWPGRPCLSDKTILPVISCSVVPYCTFFESVGNRAKIAAQLVRRRGSFSPAL